MRKNTCSKCEHPVDGNKQRYCNPCKAEWMRGNRPSYSELNEEQKKKDCARSYVGVYVRRGKIAKQPCSECGNPEAQAHHENYDKPLDVIWLCKDCHVHLHNVSREKNKKQKAVA